MLPGLNKSVKVWRCEHSTMLMRLFCRWQEFLLLLGTVSQLKGVKKHAFITNMHLFEICEDSTSFTSLFCAGSNVQHKKGCQAAGVYDCCCRFLLYNFVLLHFISCVWYTGACRCQCTVVARSTSMDAKQFIVTYC